jgi:hypothetical protein
MDSLLKKSHISIERLRNFYAKRTADELSRLVEPCYYPSLKKDYYDLLNMTGLAERDIKEFVKKFYAGTPSGEYKFYIHNDPITNLNLFLMYYSLKKRDSSMVINSFTYFMIRIYANRMHMQMKTCSKDAFKYALDNLSKSHLFSREKSIPSALFFISNLLRIKYQQKFIDQDVEQIVKFINEARHRIGQSIRSFAELYYYAVKKGLGIKEPFLGTPDEGSLEYKEATKMRGQRVVQDVVSKICIFKHVDEKAFVESKDQTKIKTSLASDIAKELSDLKYKDNISNLFSIFIGNVTNIQQICGSELGTLMGKLVRKTKEVSFFKNELNIIVSSVLKAPAISKEYKQLNIQTQKNVVTFILLYLIYTFKNSVC